MKNIFLIFGVLFLLSFSSIAQMDVESDFHMPEGDENAEIPSNLQGDEIVTPEEPDFHDGDASIDDSDVLVLTEATFDDALKNHKYILVEFYARTL